MASPAVLQPQHLTDEQRAVVDAIAHRRHNVVVNAVAGSGKTRTALAAATEWIIANLLSPVPTAHVLLVAYNKRLAQDMVVQRDALMPPTLRAFVDVRTIHGFGHHYFGGYGMTTDTNLAQWTRSRAHPARRLLKFGLVIVDEAQDLTHHLFTFLHYSLSLLQTRPQLLVLGDPFQLLYRFKGADEAFILEAHQLFADVAADVPFENFRLSICFRITHEMAQWINQNLNPNNLYRAHEPFPGWFEQHRKQIAQWWGQGIRANPRRPPSPTSMRYYARTHSGLSYAEDIELVIDKVVEVFQDHDMSSSALLSPFITPSPRSPVRVITNQLRFINGQPQPWFIDSNRETSDPTSEIELRNHRLASTIHKFKGRERDAIVLIGMDNFAEQRDTDPRNVFNMFYVGATRARKLLLIIQWSSDAYATHSSQLKRVHHDEYEPQPCAVTKALEFCPYEETLCEQSPSCLNATSTPIAEPVTLAREDYLVNGAHTPQCLTTVENISAVVAMAVKVRLQLLLDEGRLEVPIPVDDDEDQMPDDLKEFLARLTIRAKTTRMYSWASVLEIATAFLTITERLYYRWRQVRNFGSWPLVKQPAKLDELTRNLVRLLYVICEQSSEKAIGRAKNIEPHVVEEELLTRLRQLRKEDRILFSTVFQFDMGVNVLFVQMCSPSLIGQVDIIVLSQDEAKRVRRRWEQFRRKKLAMQDERAEIKAEERSGDGVTLLQIKVASKSNHDHLLQVACYGAMYREMLVEEQAVRADDEEEHKAVKIPKMFVVYPSIGFMRKVQLHMDSFEFLHRVGYRKINKPFDDRVLERRDRRHNASKLRPIVPRLFSQYQ